MPQASTQVSQMAETWYQIKASGNDSAEILIYDEIGGWGVSARSFARDIKELGKVTNITVRIHSGGGDVFEGMAIYNLLKQHPANVTVYIDGLAASMASVIAMAGDTIIMPSNTMMMVHKPWGIQGGDAEDMRRYADLLDKVEGALISAYLDKTGIDETELQALLAEETWLTGSEAVEKGFADQLVEPLQAAASLTSNRLQEFENMPKAVQELMRPQGNANPTPPANPQGGQNQPEAPAAAPQPPASGMSLAQFQAQETERKDSIKSLFANFGGDRATALAEVQQTCLDDMSIDAAAAKDLILAALGKETTPSSGGEQIYAGNGNLVGDSVRASLMARTGHEDAQADNAYNHMTLRELARASLTERGVGVAAANPLQMVGLAFTHSSSDFGNILLDVAHKSLLMGWEDADETFEQWTKKGQLSDFKPAKRVGMDAFPALRQVREGAEYKYVTVGDRGEKIALATYGELFSITRQAIINDDLSVLMGVPEAMGRAAKATIGDLVYAVLTSNPKLSDGKPLFHAEHGNLISGAPDVGNLSKGKAKMRRQKLGERNLNIRPAFALAPVALEDTIKQVIASQSVAGTETNSGVANPIRNMAEVIGEPRLDDDSATAWYLTAAQGRDTIEVAYFNGIETPFIDQMEGFTTDGVATKVRIDAGVAPLDHRGLLKSSG
ncbi:Clp protease ClpP [Ferrimonas aestuarii]|uniref:ATP-dependent Clp protease proteolytic subunit n=2 Tax=Ferrimonas aestuarii TaxID=2569539 RepID=A0A4U1BL26_9GAMM|nr:Clp protease ClpP [Ferrimonas aestuarii]